MFLGLNFRGGEEKRKESVVTACEILSLKRPIKVRHSALRLACHIIINSVLLLWQYWPMMVYVIGHVFASFSWITELLNRHLEVLSSLVSCCYMVAAVAVNRAYWFWKSIFRPASFSSCFSTATSLSSATSRDRRRSGRQLENLETKLAELLYYHGLTQPTWRLQMRHSSAQHWNRCHANL